MGPGAQDPLHSRARTMKASRHRVSSKKPRYASPALALLLTAFPLAAGCQVGESSGPETTTDLGAYLERWHETGRLNGVVLVARGDETLYEGAFGEA